MDRAYKFLDDAGDHILKMMGDHTGTWTAKELDYIIGLCDAHNKVCEFVELVEKRDGQSNGMGLFANNTRKRRV